MAESDSTPFVTLYTDRDRVPFLVDADDAFAVGRYSWYINSDGYPATSIGKRVTARRQRQQPIPLHVFLLGPAEYEWDHINRNKLDNRRANLRAVSQRENQRNRGLSRKNTSGYRGVNWDARDEMWRARITVNGKKIGLGYYPTLAAAVEARAKAEKELWS